MENNNGVMLKRPSLKKAEEKKKPTFAIGLLTILLIASYIFTIKTYEPVPNIMITGGILMYPFTFLIVAYISKYYGFKESRKSIFLSSLLFVLFIGIVMVGVLPTANNETTGYNTVIQYLFTNDFFTIGEFRIYHPLLGQFFGTIIAFIVSHLLYATVYNAISNLTVDYLAMGLSMFIGSIVDRILFMTMLFAKNLMDGVNTFDFFLKCLTSEFIGAIVTALIIVILYVILTSILEARKKRQLA